MLGDQLVEETRGWLLLSTDRGRIGIDSSACGGSRRSHATKPLYEKFGFSTEMPRSIYMELRPGR